MASVNIGGGDDQFNRYKMPPVMAKVEGRGNGIKTRIVNCSEVARALHRPPGYVCKFFGCELGAQTKIDDAAGVYIVNGAFQQNVLMDTLKKFIEMFVLCGKCNLPETDLKLKKNGNITQACNACGEEGLCDMTHKLCTFIINNPPDGKKKKDGAKGKGDKAARRALKAKKAAVGDDDSPEGEEDEKAKRRAARKAAKKATEVGEPIGLSGDINFDEFASGPGFINGDDDDEDEVEWSVDTSKEAEEARRRELGAAAAILERAPAEDENGMARKLRAYLDDGKKPSKVVSKSEKLFGADDVIQGIMMASVVDETPATMVASVQERAVPVFKHFGVPMDVAAQATFCDYMDWAASHDKTIVPVLPHILKAMYDEDLIEEESIFKWYRKDGGREDVRESVKVIVEWLENAEEESGDEDEEEAEEEDE